MDVVAANKLAHDIARYIRAHPKAIELRTRIMHITHGQGLDVHDLDQLTRKVRRLLFPDPSHVEAPRTRKRRRGDRMAAPR